MTCHPPLKFHHVETPGLVTVVTPTRNGRRFLGEALAGLAAQTYRDWELIVVEDGSQDGSEDLVRRLAAEHPGRRVVYLRNDTSCGAAYSRNRAFLESRGEYVAFLDCDDRWFPSHLAACIDALGSSGDDLAYSTVVMFGDGDERVLGVWGPTDAELRQFPRSLFARSFVTPSATVVRRDALGRVGAWDAQFRCCEDADFLLRATVAGLRFHYVGGVHVLYRKLHVGATTQQMAETIEECAAIAARYIDLHSGERKHRRLTVATSLALAAKLHSVGAAKDPSAKPERAARLYLAAWRLRPKRVRNLLRAATSALRYGVGPVRQPLVRPSLPPECDSAANERQAA